MRFYRWLMAQRDRQDAVGALARDVKAGAGIPDGDTWMQHWLGNDTDEDDLIARWRLAWAEWERCGGQRHEA